MKRHLAALVVRALDMECYRETVDVRVPWPAMRLYWRRNHMRLSREVGIYRLGSFEYSIEWWGEKATSRTSATWVRLSRFNEL